MTTDVLEPPPVYGPLPIPVEVVHYNGTLLIGRDLALWPSLFRTESDVVRYNLQRALAQVEHSAAEAPEQVEHWLWVAESYRRDLVGVPVVVLRVDDPVSEEQSVAIRAAAQGCGASDSSDV